MTELRRIIISRIFTGGLFWLPVAVLYFKFRGISDEYVYSLLGFYAICCAVLEFPTGVLGDYYSQVLSVKVGYLFISFAFLLMSFDISIEFYYVAQFLAALGMSFSSGSDTAIISQYSENLDKDLKTTKLLTQIMVIVSLGLSTFLYSVNVSLPIIITSVFFFISFLFIFNIKDKNFKAGRSGNLFLKASEGVKIVFKDLNLTVLVLLSAIIVGFEISTKFFFNQLFLDLNILSQYHGFLIALLTVLMTIGILFFKKTDSKRNILTLMMYPILLLLIGISSNVYIVISLLFVMYFTRGINDTYMDISLQKGVPQENKASVISLKNLAMRLFSSIYLFVGGYMIANSSVQNFFIALGIIFLIAIILFVLNIRRGQSIKEKALQS